MNINVKIIIIWVLKKKCVFFIEIYNMHSKLLEKLGVVTVEKFKTLLILDLKYIRIFFCHTYFFKYMIKHVFNTIISVCSTNLTSINLKFCLKRTKYLF